MDRDAAPGRRGGLPLAAADRRQDRQAEADGPQHQDAHQFDQGAGLVGDGAYRQGGGQDLGHGVDRQAREDAIADL